MCDPKAEEITEGQISRERRIENEKVALLFLSLVTGRRTAVPPTDALGEGGHSPCDTWLVQRACTCADTDQQGWCRSQ